MNSKMLNKFGVLVLMITVIFTLAACDLTNDELVIESVSSVGDIEVQYGTSSNDVIDQLPDTVEVTLSNNEVKSTELAWEAPADYEASTPGTYTFSGSFTVEGLSGTVDVDVTVKEEVVEDLTVESTIAIEETLTVGDDYTLPTTVEVNVVDQEETVEMDVEWNGTVDTSAVGTFTFEGTLTLPEGYINPDDVTATANITVEDTTQTEAPTSDLDSGTYSSPQDVILSAEEGSTIYYTLDGTVPTVDSTEYTAAIDIVEEATVKAIAVDAAGNESDVVTFYYNIDTTTNNISLDSAAATVEQQGESLVFTATLTDPDGEVIVGEDVNFAIDTEVATDTVLSKESAVTDINGEVTVELSLDNTQSAGDIQVSAAVPGLNNIADTATVEVTQVVNELSITTPAEDGDFVDGDTMELFVSDLAGNGYNGTDDVTMIFSAGNNTQELTAADVEFVDGAASLTVGYNDVSADINVTAFDIVNIDTLDVSTFGLNAVQTINPTLAASVADVEVTQDDEVELTASITSNGDALESELVTFEITEVGGTAYDSETHDTSLTSETEVTTDANGEAKVTLYAGEVAASDDIIVKASIREETLNDTATVDVLQTAKIVTIENLTKGENFVAGDTIDVKALDFNDDDFASDVAVLVTLTNMETGVSDTHEVSVTAGDFGTGTVNISVNEGSGDIDVAADGTDITEVAQIQKITAEIAPAEAAAVEYLNDAVLTVTDNFDLLQGETETITATLDLGEMPVNGEIIEFSLGSYSGDATLNGEAGPVEVDVVDGEASVELALADDETLGDITVDASWVDSSGPVSDSTTVTVKQAVSAVAIEEPLEYQVLTDSFNLKLSAIDLVGEAVTVNSADLIITLEDTDSNITEIIETTGDFTGEAATISIADGDLSSIASVGDINRIKAEMVTVESAWREKLNVNATFGFLAESDDVSYEVYQGGELDAAVKFVDGDDNPISNEEVTFSLTGNTKTATRIAEGKETVITDANGEAITTIEAAIDEPTDGLTVEAAIGEVSASQTITVQPGISELTIDTPLQWASFTEGSTYDIELSAKDLQEQAFGKEIDVDLTFYDSSGSVIGEVTESATFSSGSAALLDVIAAANLDGDTATVADIGSIKAVYADKEATVTELNAGVTVALPADIEAAQGETVSITATLLDENDNPVVGEGISLSLTNAAADTVLSDTAPVTDANGEVTVDLTVAEAEIKANEITVDADWRSSQSTDSMIVTVTQVLDASSIALDNLSDWGSLDSATKNINFSVADLAGDPYVSDDVDVTVTLKNYDNEAAFTDTFTVSDLSNTLSEATEGQAIVDLADADTDADINLADVTGFNTGSDINEVTVTINGESAAAEYLNTDNVDPAASTITVDDPAAEYTIGDTIEVTLTLNVDTFDGETSGIVKFVDDAAADIPEEYNIYNRDFNFTDGVATVTVPAEYVNYDNMNYDTQDIIIEIDRATFATGDTPGSPASVTIKADAVADLLIKVGESTITDNTIDFSAGGGVGLLDQHGNLVADNNETYAAKVSWNRPTAEVTATQVVTDTVTSEGEVELTFSNGVYSSVLDLGFVVDNGETIAAGDEITIEIPELGIQDTIEVTSEMISSEI